MPWHEFLIWFIAPALAVVCGHHAHELLGELAPGVKPRAPNPLRGNCEAMVRGGS